MCGSTSVACCPGPTVNGSELICVKFAPTGLPSCVGVGEEDENDAGDDPEHPVNMSAKHPRQAASAPLRQSTARLIFFIAPTRAASQRPCGDSRPRPSGRAQLDGAGSSSTLKIATC